MHTLLARALCVIGLFALTGAATGVSAATLPVDENFDDGVANGFVAAGSGGGYTFAGSTGAYAYQAVVNSSGPLNSSAAISVTGLPIAGYELSTTFKLTAFSSAGASNVGVGLHGDTADFSTGTQYRVLYQLSGSDVGHLQFVRNGTFMGSSTGAITPVAGQVYTLKVRVTPVAGGYTLRGTLTAGTASIAVEIAQSALLPGGYFGYRTAVNASSVTVGYDNFDMAVASTDLVVTGDLTVLGNSDLVGNSLKIGGTGAAGEAVKIDYTEVGSTYKQSVVAGRDAVEFFWGQNGTGTLKPKFKFGADNTLTIFNTAGDPSITLDPQGGVNVQGDLIVTGMISLPNQTAGNGSGILTQELADGRYIQSSGGLNAMGLLDGAEATGFQSFAVGGWSRAWGDDATALSSGFAMGSHSVAMSSGTTNGFASNAMSLGFAQADYSTAIGPYTNAQGFAQVVIGYHNLPQGDAANWVSTDDLFVIGNGQGVDQETSDMGAPSNAFVVHKNGNVRVAGNVQSRKGFRTPPMGDLSMGTFTAGDDPADTVTGLNAGLRYPNE